MFDAIFLGLFFSVWITGAQHGDMGKIPALVSAPKSHCLEYGDKIRCYLVLSNRVKVVQVVHKGKSRSCGLRIIDSHSFTFNRDCRGKFKVTTKEVESKREKRLSR